MKQTVGIVGLGIMGGAYARNLLAKGFDVVGFDVNADRRQALQALGLKPATSPVDVARQCDGIVTSLPSPAAFHAVMTGPAGLVEAGRDVVVADTSTLALADKEQAYQALAAAGIRLLDCPVSGTGAQAAKGDLVFFASGDKPAYERLRPALLAMGRVAHHLGAFGNGSRMKYVANLLVAIHNVSTAEAMAFGMKAGIAPETLYDVLCGSAATSRIFEVRGPMMVRNTYDENVSATFLTMSKDLSVIGQYANSIDCPTPLFSLASNIHAAAVAQGLEMSDTAAVCAVMERLAGVDRSQLPPPSHS
jgi:3-hydroxyisobutyrate dehydrogenase-like beta-hydroxyacid dehydrogenase